ncbi:MAG: RNA ligase family protein [Nitrococcus sp.]|nr:RNA ligase family protein [Nitrococcus sp.]
MTNAFFRFPHTPHVAWLGEGVPRDDKLLSAAEMDALLAGPVVVEEKLDGANLGFSPAPGGTVRAQNRGEYLQAPFVGQFKRLAAWLAQHERALAGALGNDLIAFGEWCAARHTLGYDSLPDWWLLFDVYDRRQGRFWSTRRRDAWATAAGVAVVPVLHRGETNLTRMSEWATSERSHYRAGPLEGVVVRREDAHWSNSRGKLVNPVFAAGIEAHWRRRRIEWNRLSSSPIPRSSTR